MVNFALINFLGLQKSDNFNFGQLRDNTRRFCLHPVNYKLGLIFNNTPKNYTSTRQQYFACNIYFTATCTCKIRLQHLIKDYSIFIDQDFQLNF